MRSIESEGDTIDQAIEKALQALNVTRDQVQVEILTDAIRGLLGFGGKKARVRATVRAPLISGLGGSEDEPSRMDSRETVPTAEHDQRTPPLRGDTQVQPLSGGASERALPSEAFQRQCKGALEGILHRLGVSCVVAVRPGPDSVSVLLDVSGDSGGLLIGRRGQTLDALEYILSRIVGREDGSSWRVMIDVEHYRERRSTHLTELARRLAEKAKQTGQPVTLNPMSARDRRVVHLALQNDQAVTTRSHGDGHYRKVIILPADRSRRPPRPKPRAS